MNDDNYVPKERQECVLKVYVTVCVEVEGEAYVETHVGSDHRPWEEYEEFEPYEDYRDVAIKALQNGSDYDIEVEGSKLY